MNEIVNSIGGKSVIFIRYNPDVIKNNDVVVKVDTQTRLDKLVEVLRDELSKDYTKFCVKLIQIYYDDDYPKYVDVKFEDITQKICV